MQMAATRNRLIEEHEWIIGYFTSMIRAGVNLIISYDSRNSCLDLGG